MLQYTGAAAHGDPEPDPLPVHIGTARPAAGAPAAGPLVPQPQGSGAG
jgi:hypothetical protein